MKIIIRIPNWIGDAVMFIPALENLKKSFKNSEIHLIGRIPAIDIFKNYPGINTFLKIRGKGLLLGIEIANRSVIDMVMKKTLDKGVILGDYLFNSNCISLNPPLTIKENEIIKACKIIIEAFNETEEK